MKSISIRHLLLSGTMILAACSEDITTSNNIFPSGNGEEDLVSVEFRLSEKINFTRAVSSIVTFDAGEKIRVCVSDNGGGSFDNYDFTTTGSGQTNVGLSAPDTPPYFPPGTSTTVQAYAYYPSPTSAVSAYSTESSSTIFTVAADQTSPANYKFSDLMYCANQTITKPNSGTLSMAHMMAQLHLNVNAVGLTVHRVVVNACNSVTFAPNTNTVTTTRDTKADIIASSGSGDAYVCIPQQQIAGVTIKIWTDAEGTESKIATFTFTSTDNFEAGSSYPINLTINAGQLGATTTITDWNGQESITFAPSGDLNVTIDPEGNFDFTYNGNEKRPSVRVMKDETELTLDTDYELRYFNNINAGSSATILVIGKGEVYNSSIAVVTFSIHPKTLTAEMVADIAAPTYTGTQQTPNVTVTDGSVLTLNTDYTLSYGENINVTTGGSITVTGMNNYTGEVERAFTILPKDISSDVTFTLMQSSYTYTGDAITAYVSLVEYNGHALSENTDYTVDSASTLSATDTGDYSIGLNGMGNYTGIKLLAWSISKANSDVTVTSPASGPLTLTNNQQMGNIRVSYNGDGTISATCYSNYVTLGNIDQSTGTIPVTARGNGTAIVTISVAETATHHASSTTVTVTVNSFPLPYQAIDLGLSVLWANINIGAVDETDFGTYFAWGETEGYTVVGGTTTAAEGNNKSFPFSWSNYNYCSGNYNVDANNKLTKYVPLDRAYYWGADGSPDGKLRLDDEDDAAKVNWGDGWRMPTQAEFAELLQTLSGERVTVDGIVGFRATASNGNSIFLPFAGYIPNNYITGIGNYGVYWSSDVHSDNPSLGMSPTISTSSVSPNNSSYRRGGLPIRPVKNK